MLKRVITDIGFIVQSRYSKEILKPSNSVPVVWDEHRALFNGIFNKDEFQRALSTAISTARRVNVPIMFTKITPSPSGFEPVTVRIAPWRGGFRH